MTIAYSNYNRKVRWGLLPRPPAQQWHIEHAPPRTMPSSFSPIPRQMSTSPESMRRSLIYAHAPVSWVDVPGGIGHWHRVPLHPHRHGRPWPL